jgi:hypothetical protein
MEGTMETLQNANGQPSSCKCGIGGITAKYEAEFLVRSAMSKVAVDLTYGDDNLTPHNSQGVNEAAMGVLTSVRHYLESYLEKGTYGPIVPGVNTAYLYTFVAQRNDGTYTLSHEVEYSRQMDYQAKRYKSQDMNPKEAQ